MTARLAFALLLLAPSARAGGTWSRAVAPSLPLAKGVSAAAAAANLGRLKDLDGVFALGVYDVLGKTLSRQGLTPESFAALPEAERADKLSALLSVQAAAAEARAKGVFAAYARESLERRAQRRAADNAEALLYSPYYVADAETRARLQRVAASLRRQADAERHSGGISLARREARKLIEGLTEKDWAQADDDATMESAAVAAQEALAADAQESGVSRERRAETARRSLDAADRLLGKLSRVLSTRIETKKVPNRLFLEFNGWSARVRQMRDSPAYPRYKAVDAVRVASDRLIGQFKEKLSQAQDMGEDDRELYRSYGSRLADILNALAAELENAQLDFLTSGKRLNQAQLWQARTQTQTLLKDVSGPHDERFKDYPYGESVGYQRDWKRVLAILDEALKPSPSEPPTPDDMSEALELAVPLVDAYRSAVKGKPQVKDVRGKKQAGAELIKLLYALAGQTPPLAAR